MCHRFYGIKSYALKSFCILSWQQFVIPGFHFPLLACDIDDIDVDLISWRNPQGNNIEHPHLNYDDYNLIFDVPHEGMKRSINVASSTVKSDEHDETRHIYSIVKQWPPEWAKKHPDDE